jgi:hypothetical protein
VCFGDTVIFKHVDSDTFLSGTIRPSGGTNGAFTVEVTKNLSDILIFKVLPFRSYERIGMPIPFDSPVKLLNTYNNGYLTFEKIGTTPPPKSTPPLMQSPDWIRSLLWLTIHTSSPSRPTVQNHLLFSV